MTSHYNPYEVLTPVNRTTTAHRSRAPSSSRPWASDYDGVISDTPPLFELDIEAKRLDTEGMFVRSVIPEVATIDLKDDLDSLFYPAWIEYQQIAELREQLHHPTGRALLHNCARVFLLAHRASAVDMLSMQHCEALYHVLKGTKIALQSPLGRHEAESEDAPSSYTKSALDLWTFIEETSLHQHIAFDHTHVPVVLHPMLDASLEVLQVMLTRPVGYTNVNLSTLFTTYNQAMRALDTVNTSLFEEKVSDSRDFGLKSEALLKVLEAILELYDRHISIAKSPSYWIALPLIIYQWYRDFESLCGSLSEVVQRITKTNWEVRVDLVLEAIADDSTIVKEWWADNLRRAAQDSCVNPRTCEALRLFPQWARVQVQDLQDITGGAAAAKQARIMLEDATPGSYEHRALIFAMYELRRSLYSSLEEWEFLQSEIELGEQLGEGASAAVHACTWLGGTAVVKVFHTVPLTTSKSTVLTTQHFGDYIHRREREIWFRLSHPYILPFLGACTTASTPMILTPLAENGTARAYRMLHPEGNWLTILTQVCSGIAFLHKEASIVHGDIKGSNVLIDPSGSPKISDFGLALMTENIYGRSAHWGGTMYWMSPELLSGRGFLTYESDVYALGMTLYELWFGKNPFDMMEPDLVVEMVVDEGVRPERENDPVASDGFWELMETCWMEDPLERLKSDVVHGKMLLLSPEELISVDDNPRGSPIEMSQYTDIVAGEKDEPEGSSIDNLSCTRFHDLPNFPEREDFPFRSVRHLVSFSVRRQIALYSGRDEKVHMETSQDGIQESSTDIPHPITRVIFRVQSKTRRDPGLEVSTESSPSRLEVALLRRHVDRWQQVTEAGCCLMEHVLQCNSSVAHVVMLGRDSSIAKAAVAGDKVALKVIVEKGYILTVESAEIEMHVQMVDHVATGPGK